MGQTEMRLQELGLELPRKDYRGRGFCVAKRYKNLIFVSGCGPDLVNGKEYRGKIGRELTQEEQLYLMLHVNRICERSNRTVGRDAGAR